MLAVAEKGMPDWALPVLEWRQEREHEEEGEAEQELRGIERGGSNGGATRRRSSDGELTRTLELKRRRRSKEGEWE
jgi:hypothetical protein